MKKSRKVLLGIATIWPIVYIFLFIASIFSVILFAGIRGGGPPFAGLPPGSMLLPLGFMGLFAVHLVTILGTLALTVFYIIRVFKTERLDQNMKIMWMLLLFFAGMFAQPVFWYLYIWRGTPENVHRTKSAATLARSAIARGPGKQQHQNLKPPTFPHPSLLTGARTPCEILR